MDDFHRHLNGLLKNPEFKRLWEEDAPNRELMKTLYIARSEQGLTQEELAQRCGIKQSNLSRIESGNGNPSLSTLKRIARGLGKVLMIDFVDPSEVERMDLSDASRTA